MKRIKAFTLIEVVIVITIVAILSTISVPIYNKYTQNAILAEGYTLLGAIRDAQMLYRSECGIFLKDDNWKTYNEALGVNVGTNKYFTVFKAGVNAQTDWFISYISGSYRNMTLTYNMSDGAVYK
ncbi:MAG: prepilin-type N-terminal cleavage/methylation domain-containing protein [Elusimicrobia bacterium]|nr:prepilin-type N-terminal cleavage/methylation domain-containing protein [Elusimicrobiota bacterium]